MITELIKTKHQKGFGLIFLLTIACFPPLPLVALIWSAVRLSNIKLNIRPNIFVFNKIDLGNVFAWGAFIMIIGFIFFLAGIDNASKGISTVWMTLMITLPIIASGSLMQFYHAGYKKYICAADTILEQVKGGKDSLPTSSLTFIGPRNKPSKYNNITLHKLLIDMKDNGVIDFSMAGSYYKISLIGSGDRAQPHTIAGKPITSWICSNCGASNNTPSTCEYCGSNKIAR